MKEFSLKANPEDLGKRLDIFLQEFCRRGNLGISRTAIQEMLKRGEIMLNGSATPKAHCRIRPGDCIVFSEPRRKERVISAENIPLDVIYEDEDLAVINKSAGVVVHPAPGNYEHTLVNALLCRFKKLSDINPQRPGIVHRLDKDTSGLLVIAKNNAAHLDLSKQFSLHSIKRKYIALVKGKVEFDQDVIEVPIGRHPFKRKNMAAGLGKNTKFARTRYRTLKRGKGMSLLEVEPYTGRTHQIRVHLAFLGHPVMGDVKYGKNNSFQRLALHAKYLGFVHPGSGKFIEFSSKIPPELSEAIRQ